LTIIICSDGTGNSDTGTPSNVRRLFDLLIQKSPTQVALYDPGVGTEPRQPGTSRLRYTAAHLRALWFGTGVEENLIQLYSWLVEKYQPGDRVFLFGFSRGAFTVRALAGLLHVCGLVRPDRNLVIRAVNLYRTSESRIKAARRQRGLPAKFGRDETTDHASFDADARDFREQFGQPCTVDFLGIWDTVKAYGWLWPRSFPALRHNASVTAVRHAVSLDERRAVFKMTGWGDWNSRVREVWFAGDHSDVGGGHQRGNSPLADAALRWMLGEATDAGLLLNPAKQAEVTRIEERSRDAGTARPKNLFWRSGFFVTDSLPRVELDNAVYPPRRNGRVFWIDGRRKPGDHAAAATVLIHESVQRRYVGVDGKYGYARLVRRSRRFGVARGVTLRVQTAHDTAICWPPPPAAPDEVE
jgi:uncharacterized protein (DUF2235 family)